MPSRDVLIENTPTDPVVPPPRLRMKKLAFIGRDYRYRFSNGRRDFSHHFAALLAFADANQCDAVVFSLFTLLPGRPDAVRRALAPLKVVKAVFVEDYRELGQHKRTALTSTVHFRTAGGWQAYHVEQAFGSLARTAPHRIKSFVANIERERTLGDCCLLICGETNAVTYSPKLKKVVDRYGLRKAIPAAVSLVVNPVHDRMTRFEMALKRRFLSQKGRWVVSVWNKGKMIGAGTRDGAAPPWQVWHDGREVVVPRVEAKQFDGVEIGLLTL